MSEVSPGVSPDAARRLGRCRAAILDLDGVLTRTAALHAAAWKQMFDAFLASRPAHGSEYHAPFDISTDYLRYVDGKPRHDGIRSFLAARNIALPEGDAHDAPEADTVHGLGARKNALFLDLLERRPVQVYDDAVAQVRRWRARGWATALITSSRNGRRILDATRLTGLFDSIVDGADAARLGIAGKPAPDIFLHAARELNVAPADVVVVEDALAGVEAAHAGGFGVVVGVVRHVDPGLRAAGAHLVVADLRQLEDGRDGEAPPVAAHVDDLIHRLDGRRLALFLDYDGTLTPIVRRPEDATLAPSMRRLLRALADRVTVAIVSGRDLQDVRRMVDLDDLYYAGSHGFDVAGPEGMRMEQESARGHLPALDAAERDLVAALAPIDGAWVERKRFAIAIHYREAADADVPAIEAAVDAALDAHPGLRKKGGKRIFELQPDVPWDKGRAVCWLLEQLDLAGDDVLPVYIGDDVTDEDAFRALAGRGIGIRVGDPHEPTAADAVLGDTQALERYCRELLEQLGARAPDD